MICLKSSSETLKYLQNSKIQSDKLERFFALLNGKNLQEMMDLRENSTIASLICSDVTFKTSLIQRTTQVRC